MTHQTGSASRSGSRDSGSVASRLRRLRRAARRVSMRRGAAMAGAVALVGLASMGTGPDAITARAEARGAEAAARRQIIAEVRAGEKAVLEDRITRLDRILSYSVRFGLPADLGAEIYDAAEAEGIEPGLAFGLVSVESSFRPRVVSSMGAVGLTQVLPSTAVWLDPDLERSDLFRRGTNLRVGFRYLRQLIDRYDGDVRTALLAYNRGPTRVDRLRSEGIDPANGYARAVFRRSPD